MTKNNHKDENEDTFKAATEEVRKEIIQATIVNTHPSTTPLSEYESIEVTWLWHHRIRAHCINLLAGPAGLGKSAIALFVAARVSTGENWPDGTPNGKSGNVVIFDAEGDIASNVKPRLEALGANMDRIQIFTKDHFSLKDDIKLFEEILKTNKPELVIYDPITSFLGEKVDGNDTTKVRYALQPYKNILAKYKTTALCITHVNKDPKKQGADKILGASSLVALSRTVYMVEADKSDASTSLLFPVKVNDAPPMSTLEYKIVDARTPKGVATSKVIFGKERMTFSPQSSHSTAPQPSLEEKAAEGIRRLLSQTRQMKKNKIVEILKDEGQSITSINNALNRNEDEFVKISHGVYSLRENTGDND